jgi:AcrR family transcriptional regulator
MSSSELRAYVRREQRVSSSLRARLLRQARAALLRHGVGGVAIEQVIAAAGARPAAAYRLFPSMESLLDALAAEAVGAGGVAVERALSAGALRRSGAPADPAREVAALVRQTVRMAERDPLLACLAEAGRGVAEAVTDDFGRRVLRSLSRGVWVGRFPVASALVQVCAIRGAVLEVLRGRLHGLLPAAAADELAAGVLQMLGLPAEEAAAIAAEPLVELPPPLVAAYGPHRRGAPRLRLISL